MKTLFGVIRSVLFNFKQDSILNADSQDIWSIKQVDGQKILSVSINIIKLWNLRDIKNPRRFAGHNSNIYGLCVINSDHFASCSADRTIKIWNLTSGECTKTLVGHSEEIWNIKLLSNGLLISCSSDKTDNKCVKTLSGHAATVFCIEELKNNLIISGSEDGSIKIWNVETS